MQTTENGAIFPMFYLPPVAYFSRLSQFRDNVIMENSEHFQKQSYRNRTTIHSPNGMLNLIVPVVKGSKFHTSVKDVRISYDFHWQRLHWLSLQTCYRSSAYFEFYEDDMAVFYEKKWDFLFDYNEAMLNLCLKFLKLEIQCSYTNQFIADYSPQPDFRNSLHPKKEPDVRIHKYFQVFEERNGFFPNLSIVDLVFNQGPQSKNFL